MNHETKDSVDYNVYHQCMYRPSRFLSLSLFPLIKNTFRRKRDCITALHLQYRVLYRISSQSPAGTSAAKRKQLVLDVNLSEKRRWERETQNRSPLAKSTANIRSKFIAFTAKPRACKWKPIWYGRVQYVDKPTLSIRTFAGSGSFNKKKNRPCMYDQPEVCFSPSSPEPRSWNSQFWID